ncbi:unnamed protein product [Larinioides sclopetarius]
MRINIFNQFLALLYKQLLLRKCHYIVTSFEVIFPIIIMSIPCILYKEMSDINSQHRPEIKRTNFQTFEPLDPMTVYNSSSTENLEFVFAPSNKVTNDFMEDSIRTFFGRYYRPFMKIPLNMNSEEEVRNYILKEQKMDEKKIMIGTVFKGFGATLPKDLDYKIFYTRDFDTHRKFVLNGPEIHTDYRYSFFTQWQTAVGDTFIKKKSTEYNKKLDYKIFLQMFPYPEYKNFPFVRIFILGIEYFIHLSLIFFIAAVVKRIVDEKNGGSKELMESMGMTKSSYWASHFMNNFITAFIIILVFSIIEKTSKKNTEFYLESDFMLFFIILLLIMANLILFCMAFSIFFNRVAYAVMAVMIVYIPSLPLLQWRIYGTWPFEDYFSLSLFHKLCICLHPSGALITSFLIICLLEDGSKGVHWRNLTEYPMVPDINMLMVIAMMVFSCFFYIFVIWYFDTVWPWQPGMRKPFYFFLTRQHWFGETSVVPDEIELVRNEDSVENFEEESKSAFGIVVIKDLSKDVELGGTSKLVLHDVSLKCFQGQITALLGHNEAGKTSLINIIAGKELPTKGSVSINGLDISTNMIRNLLGVCPQKHVLYDELSVEQHLKFYAMMKGTSLRQVTSEVKRVLHILKLSSKRAETASNLSYADKRKLNLAIAIVGGSKVLLLDEPTYGMDVESKRHVWHALQVIKHDHTVIVTTQSCEEADIVGDRIAVMAEGEILGRGTPAFIKQKLGAGYHLHVLKDEKFDFQGLKSLIAKHASLVTCENESYKEVSFNLGDFSPASPRLVSLNQTRFGDLFEQLDSCKSDLGIISYGVSFSTIKDVLLTVSNISSMKQSHSTGNVTENTSSEIGDVSRNPSHPALQASLGNQFRSLLSKHFHYCKRRWKFHIIQLAIPFILMLMCYYLNAVALEFQKEPLKLDISSVYGTTDGFYYNEDSTVSNLAETFKNVLESNDVNVKKVSEPTHYVLNYGTKNLPKYLKRLVVGGAFDTFPSGRLNLTAWHNAGSVHSMPMSILLMQTALLRHITNAGSISLVIEAFTPVSNKYRYLEGYFPGWIDIFVPLAFTFLSLSSILSPFHEKTTKAKLLQLMCGVPSAMYWIVNFLWDYSLYFVFCIFLIMVPASFFPSLYFGKNIEAISSLALFFFLYGWASLPLGYIVTILLKRENRGLSIFIGFCILFSVFCFDLLANIAHMLKLGGSRIPFRLGDTIWFLRLFPIYSITRGIQVNFDIAIHNSACDMFTPEDLALCQSSSLSSSSTLLRCCKDICKKKSHLNKNYGDCHETWNHLSLTENRVYMRNGPDALYLGLEGFIFFALLILLESRTAAKFPIILKICFRRMRNYLSRIVLRRGHQALLHENTTVDPQVLQEEVRIENMTASQQGSGGEALIVKELTKNYGNFSSVNHLSFGVNGEEYFGILGVNGAGKTSTFKMLTGEDVPSSGNAFIQRYSLVGNFRKFQSHLGYCPEVDPLIDDLTGREMLVLFGQLRGLRGYDLQNNVIELIQNLGLTNCADELTQFYSEGDKRKLSVAIALVGSPPVILLDEPTARGDLESRRLIWNALTRFRNRTGAAILLATQSIEESEALCNRLAIMVKGRFHCLGSAEQLKSKNGQGYMLTIKFSKKLNAEKVNALKTNMQDSLKNITLTGDYKGMLQYKVVDPSVNVGRLFKFMFDVKTQFELEDFSISSVFLEQIYLECSRA